MLSDTESHAIELKVLPKPHFEGGKKVAVQQGAGMAVAKTPMPRWKPAWFPQVVHPTGKQHRICSGFRLSA